MIRRLAPDVMLSARFLQIFKAPVISIPTHGILNMHPGALPYYRGLYVDVRAMMRKLDFATTTVHEVDTGIDTGTFIDEYPFPVHLNKSLFWHRLNMDLAGLNIMFQHVMKLSGLIPDDGVARKTKDYRAHGEGEYFTYPNAEEWQQFQDMGLKLYDESDIDFVKGLFDKRLPNAVRMFTVSSKGEAATEDTTTSSSQKENIQNDQSCYQRADRLISTRS
uniref:phosphoribosylglycinamide formyltransferase 1 n=1 Tax=Thalassionema nitzschioides TaxID=33649 RepID=A0A7S1H081_9STRA|mmetsp:Transcript_2721/g.2304  ORF Transcript_2721/g.2304 Transcript_2721/m.2304 type:complete len:220 (+) Transcript_2721:321-980(+)